MQADKPVERLSLRQTAKVLVCSDIHLHQDLPALTDLFCGWLAKSGPGSDWLLILGDLFDAWVGDDSLDDAAADWSALHAVFQDLKQSGTQIGLMWGNRDFLLGRDFCKIFGTTLLADELVLTLGSGPRLLLCHGDHLCADDTTHQVFRAQVRDPKWQENFLSQTLASRQQFAQSLRVQIDQGKLLKTPTIMDVVPSEADARLDANEACLLVHGHTHLPGCSVLPSGRSRWVLPDWTTFPARRGGGFMLTADQVVRVPLL